MTAPPWPPTPSAPVSLGPPMTRKQRLDQSRWWERAECLGTDPDLWGPPTGKTGQHSRFDKIRFEKASAICRRCPVRAECLEDANLTPSDDSFRAGLTARQRVDVRARNRGLA